ncbi:hypothetical protein LEMLEM_LOCUS25202 [Lemmus lemmus]
MTSSGLSSSTSAVGPTAHLHSQGSRRAHDVCCSLGP